MGNDYAGLRLTDTGKGAVLDYVECLKANEGAAETVRELAVLPYRYEPLPHSRESKNVPLVNYPDVPEVVVWVELDVRAKAVEGNVPDAVCRFSYSLDGKRFTQVDGSFKAQPELWVGAKFGFWCNRQGAARTVGGREVRLLVQPVRDQERFRLGGRDGPRGQAGFRPAGRVPL